MHHALFPLLFLANALTENVLAQTDSSSPSVLFSTITATTLSTETVIVAPLSQSAASSVITGDASRSTPADGDASTGLDLSSGITSTSESHSTSSVPEISTTPLGTVTAVLALPTTTSSSSSFTVLPLPPPISPTSAISPQEPSSRFSTDVPSSPTTTILSSHTSSPTDQTKTSHPGTIDVHVVIGVVIGSIFAIVVVVGGLWVLWRRRGRTYPQTQNQERQNDSSMTIPAKPYMEDREVVATDGIATSLPQIAELPSHSIEVGNRKSTQKIYEIGS